MDAKPYSRAFITEFILLYKQFPALWKVKGKEYKNRYQKEIAYLEMVKKMSEVEADADRDMVIRKINSLRSSHRKEIRKVRLSKESGGEVYTPKLWYFDLFSFLTDEETNGTLDGTCESSMDDENSDEYLDPLESNFQVETSAETELTSTEELSRPSSETSITVKHESLHRGSAKRMRLPDDNTSSILIAAMNEKLERMENEDQFDIVGKIIAIKLRSMPDLQRIFAEKLINDVLYEAQLGNLNRNWAVKVQHPEYYDSKLVNLSPDSSNFTLVSCLFEDIDIRDADPPSEDKVEARCCHLPVGFWCPTVFNRTVQLNVDKLSGNIQSKLLDDVMPWVFCEGINTYSK